MDDLSVVYLYTAQPISQPPDVTNNAKSTRQADRVGHYAPAHISSVRMNNSGNISGLQDDGKCLLWKNSFWNCEMVYFLCTGKIKEVCLLFSRNSTSREGLCQDTTVTKYIKGMKIWSRVVCFCCSLLKFDHMHSFVYWFMLIAETKTKTTNRVFRGRGWCLGK